MSLYHAHLYFDDSDAACLPDRLQALEGAPLRLERIHDRAVGPHPSPMAEFHFEASDQAEAIARLEAIRGTLSVLVHPETGDDHRDHTLGAHWLGRPLPLDFSFFDRVLADPSLSIHPTTRTK